MIALVICRHGVMRESLIALLSTMPEFEIVSAANDLDAALGYVRVNCPALALLVVESVSEGQADSLDSLKSACPDLQILVLVQGMVDERVLDIGSVDTALSQGVDARRIRETILTMVNQEAKDEGTD